MPFNIEQATFFLEKPRSRRFYGFEETKMPIEKMVLLKKKICPNKPVDTAGLLVLKKRAHERRRHSTKRDLRADMLQRSPEPTPPAILHSRAWPFSPSRPTPHSGHHRRARGQGFRPARRRPPPTSARLSDSANRVVRLLAAGRPHTLRSAGNGAGRRPAYSCRT